MERAGKAQQLNLGRLSIPSVDRIIARPIEVHEVVRVSQELGYLGRRAIVT